VSRRIRRAVSSLIAVLLLLGLAGFGIQDWVKDRPQAASPTAGATPQVVEIPVGSSTRDVAGILHSRGLIKDPVVFGYYARFRRLDALLKGGTYELSAVMTPEEILQKLAKGQVLVRRFTIPEGYTVVQMADALAAKGVMDSASFLKAAAASSLADRYLPGRKEVPLAQPLEGYLFPSTYDYKPGVSAEEIIELMTTRFAKVWTPDLLRLAEELKLSVHQTVTLASIIEREATVPKERAIISGVYHNRLRIGMKLDADPTVLYALHKPPEEGLKLKDLDVDSPYNTYRRAGLPPGPIAAPGELSIKAALRPEKHDFWYFVAKEDGSGEHYFARSLEEQEANIAKSGANLAARAKK